MDNQYRIWRDPFSDFAGLPGPDADENCDETLCAVKTYTHSVLAQIAAQGFNAVWIHGIFNSMVHAVFPELGLRHREHIQSVRTLIERAEKHGIKVFLYMQPPRGLPADDVFWKNHPDCAGEAEHIWCHVNNQSVSFPYRAMCTSAPDVRKYLREGAAFLTRELPALGGFILITASELISHCYAHRQTHGDTLRISCPRCAVRSPAEVAAEIIRCFRDGVRSQSSAPEIVVWNWSWATLWKIPAPCCELLKSLPDDVILMADFERGGIQDYYGAKQHFINEYALTYPGPSEYCRLFYMAARMRGLRFMTKLQLGTTHELASVVSLPLLANIFRKAVWQKKSAAVGFMGCWNFGNFKSANSAAFNFFLTHDFPPQEHAALKLFAEHYFPGCDAGLAAEAYAEFSECSFYFPYCIGVLYRGCQNYTLSYSQMFLAEPLRGGSSGPSHLPFKRGDDLSGMFTSFYGEDDARAPEDVADTFRLLGVRWSRALDKFRRALESSHTEHAALEYGNAAICGAVWFSTANSIDVYLLRRDWTAEKRAELKRIAADELNILHSVLPYVSADLRQGYHAEAHAYLFDAAGIESKIASLQKLTECNEFSVKSCKVDTLKLANSVHQRSFSNHSVDEF